MSEFLTREVIRIPYKDIGRVEILHPEKLIITFRAKINSKDIGALCYLRREGKSRNDQNNGRRVDISTLDEDRKTRIKTLIDTIHDNFFLASASTVENHYRTFSTFIDWCDDNRMHSVLLDRHNARHCFKGYIQFLKERMRRGEISKGSAGTYYKSIVEILKAYFDDNSLDEGIAPIKRPGSSATKPQDESSQGYALAWCQSLFDGLCDLVLNEKPYPYRLSIPKITGWDEDFLWLFPTKRMAMPPPIREQRDALKQGSWAYDYANGKLFFLNQIVEKYSNAKNPRGNAQGALNDAKKLLDAANADMRHYQRHRAASIASQAFLQLFYANTGQNESAVEQMDWNDSYEATQTRQGFRAIKHRGNKGQVLFEIESAFMATFKKYLALRKWILNKQTSALLFFSTGPKFDKPPSKWTAASHGLLMIVRSLDPNVPNFGSRQWRANKAQHLNNNADLATAAVALDHSIEVHEKSYLESTDGQTAEQLGQFFDSVVNAATDISENAKESSLGQCSDFGHPQKRAPNSAVSPDCHQPEGCLFCAHYYLHVDKKDIRKLASCRYVINATEHLSASPEHHTKVFHSIVARIDGLLESMRQRGSDEAKLVDRVVEEVEEEEELSTYWENELRMLISLGLAS